MRVLHTRPTKEMEGLIDNLKMKYRIFWSADILIKDIGKRVMGEDGGIDAIKKDVKAIEEGIAEYKEALRACGKRLRLEAAQVYGIPDLPMRIKDRMARMGCRTRMDIHLTTVWRYRTKGWGRKSEDVLSRWKQEHRSRDHAAHKLMDSFCPESA